MLRKSFLLLTLAFLLYGCRNSTQNSDSISTYTIAIPVWGTLYLFGSDTTINRWEVLRGKKVNVMAKGIQSQIEAYLNVFYKINHDIIGGKILDYQTEN